MDYHETFAPVAKMDSILLVLAISASKHWEVHHMDVKSAFLHGDRMLELIDVTCHHFLDVLVS